MVELLVPVILTGIFAFIGSYCGARIASNAQLRTAAQSTFLPARLEAFQKFETAIEQITSSHWNRTTFPSLYSSGNSVALVASERATKAVFRVMELVRNTEKSGTPPDPLEFMNAHAAALAAMHLDLQVYPVPKPETK